MLIKTIIYNHAHISKIFYPTRYQYKRMFRMLSTTPIYWQQKKEIKTNTILKKIRKFIPLPVINADRVTMVLIGFAVGAVVVGILYASNESSRVDCASVHEIGDTSTYGIYKKGLPEYSAEDISKHDSIEGRIWVSFNEGVYDITEFVAEHPGGDKILMAAGGSVDPFWALFAIHKSPHVLEIFEKYRIGNLSKCDVQILEDKDDPYANEPCRHVVLKPASMRPFNAEPPPSLLVEHMYTPNEIFYVRNHLPVPDVDMKDYQVDIEGIGIKEQTLSFEDIKNKFPKHTISSTLQCGGNRRSEMTKVKKIKGLNWNHAAISNAQWSGAKLRDVLISAGFDENNSEAKHVQFEGMDTDVTGSPYGASIPIIKALDPRCEVLLAYEMNGEPLPVDHGFPLRVLIPGVIGARSVKWLGRIIISDIESESHWQRNDYKSFCPNEDWSTVDFTKSPAIQEMPVTSAICDPHEGEVVQNKDGFITARGYAYSGGGRKIIRVDVSANGGESWQPADELFHDESIHPQSWSWALWQARIPVKKETSTVQLMAKAIDSSYNTQPEKVHHIWNLRGLLCNAYHKINVTLK